MIITTKDIKVKDQAPEKLIILKTSEIQPKEFVVKGKGKPKIDQVITTSTIKEKVGPLTEDQKKIKDDIKKAQKATAELKKKEAEEKAMIEKEKKEKADAEKKKTPGYKPPPEKDTRPKKPTPPPPKKKKKA